jgi:hypothetical protein
VNLGDANHIFHTARSYVLDAVAADTDLISAIVPFGEFRNEHGSDGEAAQDDGCRTKAWDIFVDTGCVFVVRVSFDDRSRCPQRRCPSVLHVDREFSFSFGTTGASKKMSRSSADDLILTVHSEVSKSCNHAGPEAKKGNMLSPGGLRAALCSHFSYQTIVRRPQSIFLDDLTIFRLSGAFPTTKTCKELPMNLTRPSFYFRATILTASRDPYPSSKLATANLSGLAEFSLIALSTV